MALRWFWCICGQQSALAAESLKGTLVSGGKRLEIRHFCFAACGSSIRQEVFAGPKSLDAPEPKREYFGTVRAYLSPKTVDFCGDPGRQQCLSVLLDRKAEYAPHIEALGAGRGDPADQFRRYGAAATHGPGIEDRLHFRRVPGHDDVGEQA